MKLELQNLSFSYGTQEILHDLSFSVAEANLSACSDRPAVANPPF